MKKVLVLPMKALLTIFITIIFLFSFTTTGMAFSISIHKDILSAALDFLRPDVLNNLRDQQLYVDTIHQLQGKWHFDNCEFSAGIDNVNEQYTSVLGDLNPDNPNLADASDGFGRLLHPIQDLYAHSNWIESGRRTLIDDGLAPWSPLAAFGQSKGMIIIQGEDRDIPADISLQRSGSIVYVNTAEGIFLGLITGQLWYEPDECPDSIAISHGDLNKDEPGAGGAPLLHPAARALATKQTMHEWCRLVNLVHQSHGGRGVQFLFDNWAADRQRAWEVCADLDVAFVIYVDQAPTPEFELGTKTQPFHNLAGAVQVVPDRSTIIMVSGQYTSSDSLAKPMVLKAKNGTVLLTK